MKHEDFTKYIIDAFEKIEGFKENDHFIGWQKLAKPQEEFIDLDGCDIGIDIKKNIVIFNVCTKFEKRFNIETQEKECLEYFNKQFLPEVKKRFGF